MLLQSRDLLAPAVLYVMENRLIVTGWYLQCDCRINAFKLQRERASAERGGSSIFARTRPWNRVNAEAASSDVNVLSEPVLFGHVITKIYVKKYRNEPIYDIIDRSNISVCNFKLRKSALFSFDDDLIKL